MKKDSIQNSLATKFINIALNYLTRLEIYLWFNSLVNLSLLTQFVPFILTFKPSQNDTLVFSFQRHCRLHVLPKSTMSYLFTLLWSSFTHIKKDNALCTCIFFHLFLSTKTLQAITLLTTSPTVCLIFSINLIKSMNPPNFATCPACRAKHRREECSV